MSVARAADSGHTTKQAGAYHHLLNMSNSIPSLAISKTSNPPSQTPSPSQAQSSSSVAFDGHPQRRSGGSGSFGAGSTSRSSPSTPRNNQSLRKKHKGQRLPRLADEDAFAESVCICRPSAADGWVRSRLTIRTGRRPCSLQVVGKGGLRLPI